MKEVNLSWKELMETYQIIMTVAMIEDGDAEMKAAANDVVMRARETSQGCAVNLNQKEAFRIWLTLSLYRDFLIDTGEQQALPAHVALMIKFAA